MELSETVQDGAPKSRDVSYGVFVYYTASYLTRNILY
jgi:hypothetical protein